MIYRNKPINELVSLRDAMDRLFEQSFIRPGTAGTAERPERTMAVNLCEKGDTYYVQAFLPGVKADEVEISVDQNTLNLEARIPSELEKEEAKDYRWYMTELGYGDVSRSITFPSLIDAGKIEASQENGVLTVAVPKAEESKPKQTKVKTTKLIEGEKNRSA